MSGPAVWSTFVVLAGVIVYAGPRLSRYGDVIAEKTGVGRTWIGVILLALVTSLPELATSAAAAALSLPDVVFGNVFGSNLFNLVIIGVLDFMTRRGAALHLASRNHLLTSSYGAMMMALALLPMVLYNLPGLGFAPVGLLGHVDPTSLLLIALYVVGMRQLFLREQEDQRVKPEVLPERYRQVDSSRAYRAFLFYGALIVGAGIGLGHMAEIISSYQVPLFGRSFVIGQSLVGIVLMAVVTSLPELTVSIGAVRLGAVDMAVGNVLGSNMFNMLIIGIADFFYPAGALLSRPTMLGAARTAGLASHIVTGLGGILLTGIVAATLARRAGTDRRIALSTPVLFAVFLAIYALLFGINFR